MSNNWEKYKPKVIIIETEIIEIQLFLNSPEAIFLFEKGYKCFDPMTPKMFITMDVVFFENEAFFSSVLQGQKQNEDTTNSLGLDFLKIDESGDNRVGIEYENIPNPSIDHVLDKILKKMSL